MEAKKIKSLRSNYMECMIIYYQAQGLGKLGNIGPQKTFHLNLPCSINHATATINFKPIY